MKIAMVVSAIGLSLGLGGAARAAIVENIDPIGPAVPGVFPPGAGGAAGTADVTGRPSSVSPPPDAADDAGLTTADYATGLDYDVTYDDTVANTYDDGYDPQAYNQFADTLAPHGTWVDDPAYGQVWVPSEAEVGADFSPYATNGDWVDSEYGWTWVSGWPWGWAPFHYGRWAMLPGRGWGWVPGTLWGPAWVSWRAGGGYAGWAPLPPRGVALGSPLGPRSPWRFTAAANLGHTHGAYLPSRMVPEIFGRTMVVSNARSLPNGRSAVRVNAGPPGTGVGGVFHRPVRLASAAPGALPRRAIAPRMGVPIASRSWVQMGVSRQMSSTPYFPGAGGAVPGRPGPSFGGGAAPYSSGARGLGSGARYGGGSYAGPVARAWAPARGYGAPTSYGYGTPTVRSGARPTWTAPRSSYAPPPTFSRPAAPSFGGGGHAFVGGGGTSFGGGARSFSGGGSSFGGGHSSGGGGRRR